ncbi:MAG: ATP-dependent Clp protease proteolytic subunit [Parcubacteria group bacterium]|nr:ATP-dependent Clp protease proteolytic subunit [Parcubacteria group bacterium]
MRYLNAIDNELLILSGSIAEITVKKVTERLASFLEKEGGEEAAREPRWFNIQMTSLGGTTPEGIALYDLLMNSGCNIRTIALGEVSSMALVLFLAGAHRVAGKYTRFHIHEGAFEYKDLKERAPSGRLTLTIIGDMLRELKDEEEIVAKIFAERTRFAMSEKNFHELAGGINGTRLTAEQALELGIIHEILKADA